MELPQQCCVRRGRKRVLRFCHLDCRRLVRHCRHMKRQANRCRRFLPPSCWPWPSPGSAFRSTQRAPPPPPQVGMLSSRVFSVAPNRNLEAGSKPGGFAQKKAPRSLSRSFRRSPLAPRLIRPRSKGGTKASISVGSPRNLGGACTPLSTNIVSRAAPLDQRRKKEEEGTRGRSVEVTSIIPHVRPVKTGLDILAS